jgi:hypothetical protein
MVALGSRSRQSVVALPLRPLVKRYQRKLGTSRINRVLRRSIRSSKLWLRLLTKSQLNWTPLRPTLEESTNCTRVSSVLGYRVSLRLSSATFSNARSDSKEAPLGCSLDDAGMSRERTEAAGRFATRLPSGGQDTGRGTATRTADKRLRTPDSAAAFAARRRPPASALGRLPPASCRPPPAPSVVGASAGCRSEPGRRMVPVSVGSRK